MCDEGETADQADAVRTESQKMKSRAGETALDGSARSIIVLIVVGMLVGVLSVTFGIGGGTVIGRDSVIGSNVFITHSIPPCTTVSVKSQELQFKPRNCEGNCASCTKPEPFWEGQK